MKHLRSSWKTRFVLTIISLITLSSLSLAQVSSYDKGLKAYGKKDYKTAVKHFEAYIKDKPDPYTYYLLGYALYKMKKYPESVNYFREAYTLNPFISAAGK
jgi:TolA-binding protein